MSVIDPIPRPHLPPPVRIGPDQWLTLVLTPAESQLIQAFLRGRGSWIEPIAGTEDDLDPVYGVMSPGAVW